MSLEEAIEAEYISADGTDGNGNPVSAAWDLDFRGRSWWKPGCRSEEALIEMLEWHQDGSVVKITSEEGYALLDGDGYWEYSDCVLACLDCIQEVGGRHRELLEGIKAAIEADIRN